MKKSKKYNKLGVKFLASVLSAITLLLGSAPCAGATNAKEVGSGNSVVRKIKDVGSRANEFAKRGWIKISTWIKNHPKTTIAIGTVVVLAIVGTVGFVCYKSNKGKKEKERLEAAKKAAEEAAKEEATRKAAEKPEKAEEEKKEEEEKPEEEPAIDKKEAIKLANYGVGLSYDIRKNEYYLKIFEGRCKFESAEDKQVVIKDIKKALKSLKKAKRCATQLINERYPDMSDKTYEKHVRGLGEIQFGIVLCNRILNNVNQV